MKLSARNALKGTVKEIERGSVNAVVKLDVGGQELTSMVTMDAINDMGIKEGDEVYAIVKASNVILATM